MPLRSGLAPKYGRLESLEGRNAFFGAVAQLVAHLPDKQGAGVQVPSARSGSSVGMSAHL